MGHHGGVGGHLGGQALLEDHVPGEQRPVGLAPVVEGLHVALDEQLLNEPPKAVAGAPVALLGEEQVGQAGFQVLTVGRAVALRQDQRPGDAVARDLRLVGEQPGHCPAQILCIARGIGRIGLLDKEAGDLRVQDVDIIGVHLVEKAQGFARGSGGLCDGALQVRGGRGGRLVAEVLLLVALAATVHPAVAETGGPAVLVIGPGAHAPGPRLLDAGGNVGEPLLAEVGGLQAAAGVHEIAAQTGGVHLGDLAAGLLHLQPLVPRPEGDGAVHLGRVLQEARQGVGHRAAPSRGGWRHRPYDRPGPRKCQG